MGRAVSSEAENIDAETVAGFGDEWSRFDFAGRSPEELDELFGQYFSLFPWEQLPDGAVGFDAGCGSGRWAARVAPRIGALHCVDASEEALEVARRNLAGFSNCRFACATIDEMPIADGSMDFGYSLGVLHHIPDTRRALAACVKKLKPGAPILFYLYYALDNRPVLFRAMWKASDVLRKRISKLPFRARYLASQAIAAGVYWPFARTAAVLERLGLDSSQVPLHFYRDRSFYMMRNDALDRFGTRLEQRFTRAEIDRMMRDAGLERISFRDGPPYWCALGFRAHT
jgi:SAM-dependent methyltransferase